jgi:hypothetical protein
MFISLTKKYFRNIIYRRTGMNHQALNPLWVKNVLQKRYVEIIIPATSELGFIWN